jgi:hypothetical protein
MLELVRDIAASRWFQDPSPFRCCVQPVHPRLCVITGPNASGKSLVRKILAARYQQNHVEYIHTSQEKRASSSGIQRVFIYGDEAEDSTGFNSVKMVLTAIRTGQGREKPFGLMLDEPEIGCSEETAAAIGIRVARDLETMTHLDGLYIITHSRALVARLLQLEPTHWRLEDDETLTNWAFRLTRPVESLEDLIKTGHARWGAVNGMLKR